MGGAERVVFALRALGEAGESPALAQRVDAIAPTGEDLVRIGLMADVPDQPVARRVEDVVQRDGELDHAEPGAEVAAGDRNGADRFRAQLVGELAQVAQLQLADVGRVMDAVEERSARSRQRFFRLARRPQPTARRRAIYPKRSLRQ